MRWLAGAAHRKSITTVLRRRVVRDPRLPRHRQACASHRAPIAQSGNRDLSERHPALTVTGNPDHIMQPRKSSSCGHGVECDYTALCAGDEPDPKSARPCRPGRRDRHFVGPVDDIGAKRELRLLPIFVARCRQYSESCRLYLSVSWLTLYSVAWAGRDDRSVSESMIVLR